MDTLTKTLRLLREQRGLSQRQVASLLSTTQQQYSRYENGEAELPLHHLRTLLRFYGVSPFLLAQMLELPPDPSLKEKEPSPYGPDPFVLLERFPLTPSLTCADLLRDVLDLSPSDQEKVVDFIARQKHAAQKRLSEHAESTDAHPFGETKVRRW